MIESQSIAAINSGAARSCCFAVFAVVCALTLFNANGSARPIPADWTVRIKTTRLEHCLDFPKSELQPFIKAEVRFEQPVDDEKELGDDDQNSDTVAVPPTHYENLFYGGSHILGLKRLSQLSVASGTTGVIKIDEFTSVSRTEEANAASNAIVRMFVDLYRRGAALRFVEIPDDSFDLLINELKNYGFRPANIQPDRMIQALFSLNVRSSSGRRTEDLIYGN